MAYQVALRFFGWAVAVVSRMPRRMGHLSSQFVRAALLIMLNIAEAAGMWTRGDKPKHHASARDSTSETAALLDRCWRRT